VRLCDLGEPPNAVPRCATRFPDVELRDDDLILVDRILYVAYLLSNALFHGRTDQFDTNLGFLARYPNVPIARSHLDALGAVRKVIDGDEIDEHELQTLATYCAESAPIHLRLASARAAVSYGGRRQADRLIKELGRGRAGEIADALMQAVLALHDDRVLDAGRLVTDAMAAEADFVWIELRPDLLEVAAVVSSRCDDHERALLLLGAGQSARAATGVNFRNRDQQQWIDDLRERAAQVGNAAADALTVRGASMTTDDALAYARRGSGERRRPATGWDALTPTELQVANLVAHGLTNPQIAQRLLMSRATVKTHVSHCLTKLAMATRSEIAAEATRHGD
jgi:DNA-binding NarL/FixJ family response regulator